MSFGQMMVLAHAIAYYVGVVGLGMTSVPVALCCAAASILMFIFHTMFDT